MIKFLIGLVYFGLCLKTTRIGSYKMLRLRQGKKRRLGRYIYIIAITHSFLAVSPIHSVISQE